MRTINLYGELADNFISKIDLEVNSVREAIRALVANYKGFEKYLLDYTPGFHVKVGNIYRDEDSLENPLDNNDIHIIPAIIGSGKVGMLIAGAVLLFITAGGAASILANTLLMETGITSAVAAATVSSTLASVGMGLVMMGISAILFPQPKPQNIAPQENTPNTYFNGAVNTISQGMSVPIGYGELIIGSAVISAGITIDSSATAATYSWFFPEVGTTGWALIGGSIYYKVGSPNLKYNTSTGIYTWTHTVTKHTNSYGYEGEYYGTSSSNVIVTFSYNELTDRFTLDSSSCSLNDSIFVWGWALADNYTEVGSTIVLNYTEYCKSNGSSTIPSGWGT